MAKYDVCVVGGGIVGLSVAMQLQQLSPGLSVVVVEKEAGEAKHQTSHNSGVIHAGIYYEPGSLKARFCRIGVDRTIAFCREHDIPFEQCGKLIVATDDDELSKLAALIDRGRQNGLTMELLDSAELRRREPHIVGLGAARIADTGITDYPAIAAAMAREIVRGGGDLRFGTRFVCASESATSVMIETYAAAIEARYLVVCGGLQADRLAKACGLEIDFTIIPFRGDYYRLDPRLNGLIEHLIYPVPDPSLPFLGVHLTRMIDGGITVGPNASLAFAREGYRRSAINAGDLFDMARSQGFWRMIWQHRKASIDEFHSSISKKTYLERCRKYCPELDLDDLLPYPCGIRAQAVRADGTQINDFLLHHTARSTHVCNAPSPAATASLPIGEHIARLVKQSLATIS